MAHKIFISYSMDTDENIAERVCNVLEDRGLKCWMARRDGGDDWSTSVIEAVEKSRVVVLILSADSNESDHVKKELHAADSIKVPIIILRIEDVQPSKTIKYYISHLNWINAFPGPTDDHLHGLVKRVQARVLDEPSQRETITKQETPARFPAWAFLVITIVIIVAVGAYFLVINLKGLNGDLTPGKSSGSRIEARVPSQMGSSEEEPAEFDDRYYAFFGAFPFLNWIVYDPSDYDFYENHHPSTESIRTDLSVLRREGFGGIITINSQDDHKEIAGIAHEVGIQMVIVGVWDISDQEEVNNALEVAEHADAYCLGHTGLNKTYSFEYLQTLAYRFREETGRPVTTSEYLATYEATPVLVELGDFLFPDTHCLWHHGLSPQQAWDETMEYALRAAALVADLPDMPVLLKMVSYPSGGAVGLTPATQEEFYRLLVEERPHMVDWPGGVSVSYMCAFDPEWKNEEYGWEPPERFTGLFTIDREPKDAITLVNWGG